MDCTKAKPVCTIPGPMFYVEKDKAVDVAWVYNISNTKGHKTFKQIIGSCMSSQGSCSLAQKLNGDRELCTYLSPTNQTLNNTFNKDYVVTIKNIPMVTHLHGLEVRPTFDGNPTSWIGQ